MKKTTIMMTGILVLTLLTFTCLFAGDDQEAVKKVIKSAYFNGAFNDLDTQAMEKGFHPDFAIFSAKGNELGKYPIATWIKAIEKMKKTPSFDPKKNVMDCKIVKLDVTGGCASAKVELRKIGKLIFTDYLSLLQFDDGWKIVAKVSHRNNL